MGVVDDNGKIINKQIFNYPSLQSENVIFDKISEYVSKNSKDVESIGIGVPGIVRDNKIIYTCNLPLENINVEKYLKTDLPIYLGNDAVCATIAEYHYIDNHKHDNYLLMTIGTGVGAGVILNKNLYLGKSGAAGEIGHMVIEREGIQCNCGRKGCFEKYVSIKKLLQDTGTESLKEFFYIVERNEKIANMFDKYLNDLAEGIANVINVYDVDVVVIGGSISWFGDKYIHILRSKVREKIYNDYTYKVNIKCARLGNDAGIIGASLLSKYIKY